MAIVASDEAADFGESLYISSPNKHQKCAGLYKLGFRSGRQLWEQVGGEHVFLENNKRCYIHTLRAEATAWNKGYYFASQTWAVRTPIPEVNALTWSWQDGENTVEDGGVTVTNKGIDFHSHLMISCSDETIEGVGGFGFYVKSDRWSNGFPVWRQLRDRGVHAIEEAKSRSLFVGRDGCWYIGMFEFRQLPDQHKICLSRSTSTHMQETSLSENEGVIKTLSGHGYLKFPEATADWAINKNSRWEKLDLQVVIERVGPQVWSILERSPAGSSPKGSLTTATGIVDEVIKVATPKAKEADGSFQSLKDMREQRISRISEELVREEKRFQTGEYQLYQLVYHYTTEEDARLILREGLVSGYFGHGHGGIFFSLNNFVHEYTNIKNLEMQRWCEVWKEFKQKQLDANYPDANERKRRDANVDAVVLVTVPKALLVHVSSDPNTVQIQLPVLEFMGTPCVPKAHIVSGFLLRADGQEDGLQQVPSPA